MSVTGAATYTSVATIWRLVSNDGYGKVFSGPEFIYCTYKTGVKQKYVDSTGSEFVPQSQIWTELKDKYTGAILELPTPNSDMILIGESAEPNPIDAGAKVIGAVMTDDESMFGELPDHMILTRF